MVFLALSGVVLFGVSVGALALPDNFRERVFQTTWNNLNTADKTVSVTDSKTPVEVLY